MTRELRRQSLGERYLVTGGAGFVGTGVVRALLDRGEQVTVVDSGVAAGFGYLAGLDARIVRADVRQSVVLAEALSDCRAVVHLAAQASVPASIASPLEDMAVNVEASVRLLDAMHSAGVKRIVFASSNAVTGGHPPPAHEELVPRPVSPYGASKAAVEAYLAAYRQAFGIDGVALRFANAYGPWSAHKTSVVASFTRAHLAGGPLTIRGTGSQTRDYVHLDDVVRVVVACLDAPADLVAGEIFQVGSGIETSLLELAELLFEIGGRTVPVEHQPATPGDVQRNFSDVRKVGRVLGLRPQVDLRAGLADTLDWFRRRPAA